MGTDAASQSELRSIIDAALRGELTRAQADRANDLGRDATNAVMLAGSAHIAAQARRIAELSGAAPGPHTPSGAVPPYAKPVTATRRLKKPGARDGHDGHRRPAPVVIDRVEPVAELAVCPDCHGPVLPARRQRRCVVEDMPEDTRVEAVEYVIPRH